MTAKHAGTDRPARVVAVSLSQWKGVVKENVPEITLVVEHGVAGDAHAEGGKRQVSLLALESIEKMRAQGADVKPGDFAENITTEHIAVEALPVGAHLKVGEAAELVITQIGKACHHGCAIRQLVGDCIMPREGVFARVVKGGVVRPGDAVEVVEVTEDV
jgi:MOSC domain-containing protein YiiM